MQVCGMHLVLGETVKLEERQFRLCFKMQDTFLPSFLTIFLRELGKKNTCTNIQFQYFYF